jgi:hypothetical protein
VRWGKMGVPHRRLNRLVPHQLSHCAQIDARHHQPAGERVPQAIPGKIANTRFLHRILEPELVTIQLLPLHINKNRTDTGQ